jgi:hypothetical protein
MRRQLNSDQLGVKGEQRFAELCADAGLICNKSGRDRAEWDFIVEFPFPPPAIGTFLDRRPQPPECRSQVKTVWSGAKYVKLRLSSAERLAKLILPACIFVLTVKQDLCFEAIYCIHILDDILSGILRKVRECQASDATKINKIGLNRFAVVL